MDKDATNRKTAGREGHAPAGQDEASTQLEVPPPAAEMAPAELEDLKAQAAKAGENWDRFVRLTADFDNYKKRAARERQEAVAFANENLLARLVPVLDAFEMALAAANNDPAAKSLQAGIVMISNQLKSVLAEAGLEKIDASGKPFDPNLHEAVSQEPSADAPEGQVLRQIRHGYKFRNRLLRPAGVVVAKKPAA
jgi:molecular chaperone GrpE